MIPRIVVAGTSSGAGKTSVACGLIAALRRRGLAVQGFKVGPDFIDPTYHALASGRPGRNLDAFLSGADLIAPLVRHGSVGADIAVVEGVMGLFDGASGQGELASTGHVAKLLDAPVLLVIDAASMARSAAAIVHGFRTFDPDIRVEGVVVNKVGSDFHAELLREAIEPMGASVLGAVRRDARVEAPERHLGLIPADERAAKSQAAIEALGDAVEAHVDLDRVIALARSAPAVPGPAWSEAPSSAPGGDVTVAIARGSAFSFHYTENLELLQAAGARLAGFDPVRDEALPAGADALILAGGFPEVYGAELSDNVRLREQVAAFARSGRPVLAECGGLLYLCDELDDRPMCGVIRAKARMDGGLSIGYREAAAVAPSPCWEAGEAARGHEFHYSSVDPSDAGVQAAWTLSARGRELAEGFVAGGVHASYLHVHWAAFPAAAERIVAAARAAVVPT